MTTNQRLIPLHQAMNFRDLGGYQTKSGQTVSWGRIFRADSLSYLDDHDRALLNQLNLQTVCDLRSTYEQHMAPDQLDPNWQLLDCHIYPEDDDDNQQLDKPLTSHNYSPFADMYRSTLLSTHSQAMFAKVLQAILALPAEKSLVFHCSAGKDRTGMMAAIILALLGVDDEMIIRDYLLTNQLYRFSASDQLPSDNEIAKMVANMNLTRGVGQVMTNFLDGMRDGWGSIDNYAIQQLQMSANDLAQLKQKLLN